MLLYHTFAHPLLSSRNNSLFFQWCLFLGVVPGIGILIAFTQGMMTQTTTQSPVQVVNDAICLELNTLERMARWYTGSPSDAEDLLQDTIVLALRFAESYREGTNVKAWLLRVMRNRHISMSRRRQLERRVYDAEGRYSLTNWSVGECGRRAMERGGNVDKNDGLSDPVLSAIRELRPEFRQAVWLCDVQGLSYAEAAQSVSCPVGTIMSRLHRGRRHLKRQLVSREALEAAA